jgi:hypothetical protein
MSEFDADIGLVSGRDGGYSGKVGGQQLSKLAFFTSPETEHVSVIEVREANENSPRRGEVGRANGSARSAAR